MNSELFGYDWGDVNDKKSRLGNLLHIKNTLQKKYIATPPCWKLEH